MMSNVIRIERNMTQRQSCKQCLGIASGDWCCNIGYTIPFKSVKVLNMINTTWRPLSEMNEMYRIGASSAMWQGHYDYDWWILWFIARQCCRTKSRCVESQFKLPVPS
jgi:hypothetical protein